MEFVTLRRAGGSLTLTIPMSLVRLLGLSEGARVGVSVDAGKLIAEPASERPHYALDELLRQCEPTAAMTSEDEAWLADRPVGAELI